jgi:formylglycine-generating enzyme required for sulfatase activity
MGAHTARAITIKTVPVDNPGNPADTRYVDSHHPNGVGSVNYLFRIGTTEVTNEQYVALLNAVAASDPHGLYTTSMSTDPQGGIIRSGVSGGYTYELKPAALAGSYTYDDKPVVFVSGCDAMRFANWLHNGQPSGPQDASTTEDGAYPLNGALTHAALAAVTRNAAARWWLPSEDEWYKAAYFDPDAGLYYDYPTGTNSVPNNNPPSSDTGNSANYLNDGEVTTGNRSYPMTDVGAYLLSGSPYATFDQGGNVLELNETRFADTFRGLRGGSWPNVASNMHSSFWLMYEPSNQNANEHIGFRVAYIPEPNTLLLTAFTACGLLPLSWRRSSFRH